MSFFGMEHFDHEQVLADIDGYFVHYGLESSKDMTWTEMCRHMLALLRHMEDVLPAPTKAVPHPCYPEREGR